MIKQFPSQPRARKAVSQAFLLDETKAVNDLLSNVNLTEQKQSRANAYAKKLVIAVRKKTQAAGGINAFMQEYDLSSQEGVMLLCLAEALLRIPDAHTADRLIRDKLSKASWDKHLGQSESFFVNAGTWGLMLTGKITKLESDRQNQPITFFNTLLSRLSEPVMRAALKESMRIIGHQFVMSNSVENAVVRSKNREFSGYLFSFDMLGEAALSEKLAQHYFNRYLEAIAVLRNHHHNSPEIDLPSVSVKLSALHPRFEFKQYHKVISELGERLYELASAAQNANIGLTIDAEEADRLELTLDLFTRVFSESRFQSWPNFGLVVQTYQKNAPYVINWLKQLAGKQQRRIPLRVVKGAYWDSEIKRAQELGLPGYPVFTRKEHTDLSYLACAQQVFDSGDLFYPQFATHNAHTIATILQLAGDKHGYEMQRLHGMGDVLYDEVINSSEHAVKCRIYAPVGDHKDLLPYLVRRLLENGTNTSFINRISDESLPIEALISNPISKVRNSDKKPHPSIPVPENLFAPDRQNSLGFNLSDWHSLGGLSKELAQFKSAIWQGGSIIGGELSAGEPSSTVSSADQGKVIGQIRSCSDEEILQAMELAYTNHKSWASTAVENRVMVLRKAAELLQHNAPEFIALIVAEAGRCIPDAVAEVREAVDFCRYYAHLAALELSTPRQLPGPTGEINELSWHGRGVFLCISPWNFPLAIFVGQVAAALVAGNSVIAKPAGFTPLVAVRAVRLFHQAGVPEKILHLVIADGERVSHLLLPDNRLAGVAFTGSIISAQHINIQLAKRTGPIIPLIAETGGQNAMIVDSSALPEQVVHDVLASAFNSAGQRCSALRVLFLPETTADNIINLLCGAMIELCIGDPQWLRTDVGSLISNTATSKISQHIEYFKKHAKLLCEVKLPQECNTGSFVAPTVFEIENIKQLHEEVFGPVLHIIRYKSKELDNVIQSINDAQYGLTLGIHSRVESTAQYIQHRVRVGNIYVNRNIIGAAVGVQPFGGEGLSGTGPKAGGPHYLYRFATERVVTTNTAAIGGDTQLLIAKDS